MMRTWERRYRWSVIVEIGVLIIALILWMRFVYLHAPAQLPAEGVLVWTVWSQVREGIAAGLRGANVPTGLLSYVIGGMLTLRVAYVASASR